MNDFVLMRQELYYDLGSREKETVEKRHRTLWQSLLSPEDKQDTLVKKIIQAKVLLETDDISTDSLFLNLSAFGQNPYLDRYTLDVLIQKMDSSLKHRISEFFTELISEKAAEPKSHSPTLDSILKAAIELDLNIEELTSTQLIYELVQSNDTTSCVALLRYLSSRPASAFQESIIWLANTLTARVNNDYGLSIELAFALSTAFNDMDNSENLKSNFISSDLKEVCKTFGNGLASLPSSKSGLVLMQFMFYGDPARLGRGNSGGIGALLNDLGNELGGLNEVNMVFTVVPFNTYKSRYALKMLEPVAEGHTILRFPVYLSQENAFGFLLSQAHIEQTITRLIKSLSIDIDIFHLRYLDNASYAAARVASQLSTSIVTTLTPDPHRTMCDSSGRLKQFNMGDSLERLNKIYIGDELVRRSNGIVGIGQQTLEKEVLHYYPQLENIKNRVVRNIDEGIKVAKNIPMGNIDDLLTSAHLKLHLDQVNIDRPVILNIGRLHPIKGQINLVEAWTHFELWKDYNLVLIGGDFEHPNSEEAGIIKRINEHVTGREFLKGKIAHLEAQQNWAVRGVESHFAARQQGPLPDLYVCSSLKEEFGLSIVEAMSVGLITFAPLNGGANTYVRHGINGFLIDTSNAKSLGRELKFYITDDLNSWERNRQISKLAQQTIEERYSIQKIARDFSSFYQAVLHENE